MSDIPMLRDFSVSCGPETNPGSQRNSVSDHVNGLDEYSSQKSDSFAIEIDTFSHAINKDTNTNSRITLQRNLSRKGSQRQGEKKVYCSPTLNEREAGSATSSPRGSSTPEKPMAVGTVLDHNTTNPQVNHQITITSSSLANSPTECKSVLRRNSFRRTSSWTTDPKRVLFFFALLSSVGTIVLIYFTLACKRVAEETDGGFQQQ